MFKVSDLVCHKENNSLGRGEIVSIKGNIAYVEFVNSYYLVEVELSKLRMYDALDEYDDMYCDKCGGTACLC